MILKDAVWNKLESCMTTKKALSIEYKHVTEDNKQDITKYTKKHPLPPVYVV